MPFIEINGLPGKVYVPDKAPASQKKNKCPDCFSCQLCSDTRCQVCTNNNHFKKEHQCSCGQPADEKQHI